MRPLPTGASWRDPRAWLEDKGGARAQYLVCSHVLERVAESVEGRGVAVLAVKGAGLAHTVYPKPWLRPMSDIDLLVRPGERGAVMAGLVRGGFTLVPAPRERRWSRALLDETVLQIAVSRYRWTLELHHGLDKVVSRPVPYDDIRQRSVALPRFGSLRAPSLEDHVLLVCLHATASVIAHPIALLDLELLLEAGADLGLVVRRATRWRLRSALYLCLAALHALGSHHVGADTIELVRPGRARRWLMRAGGLDDRAVGGALHDWPGGPPGALRRWPGIAWAARQTPLRDDALCWIAGLGRYAALRVADRVAATAPEAARDRIRSDGPA
jgi:hypothetical protein